MIVDSYFSDWIKRVIHFMGGCFGCCTKSTPITAVDEPSNGLKIQGRTVQKTGISDGFWSTSTCDLENSALQSQRSVSSISISNQSLGLFSTGTGSSSNNHSEFVNHGFLRWNQGRHKWVESKRPEKQGKAPEPVLNWHATYESLLGTNRRFPQRIPLPEMVEFLVDIWEQEGLYD